MKLLIVESPNKVNKIKSFLDKEEWIVTSSAGHIRELSNRMEYGIGVDLDTMQPNWKILEGRRKIIDEINNLANNVDEIFLATDPDREGEAIAWHITQILENDRPIINRIIFNEITKNAVLKAIANPVDINMDLVYAQQARQILDKMIGFRLSNFTRKKVNARSAGRVKSSLLNLIVEREREILKFIPTVWYTIEGELGEKRKLVNVDSQYKIRKYDKKSDAEEILKNLSNNFEYVEHQSKEIVVYKPWPLDMASVLQGLYKKYKINNGAASRSLQSIYEKGMISYPRTDSTRISSTEFLHSMKKYVEDEHNDQNYEHIIAEQSANSQDAHEAIRPTNLSVKPEDSGLTGNDLKVYSYIFTNTIKTFLGNGKDLSLKHIYRNGDEFFSISNKIILEPGFRAVDGVKKESFDNNELRKDITIDEKIIEIVENQTTPPKKFNQASLIKLMKEKGIGRPSTYTSTTQGLIKFNYIEDNAGKITPTDIAFDVSNLLVKTFPEIVDYNYTAKMEVDLDSIASSKLEKNKFLIDFWNVFSPKVDAMEKEISTKKPKQIGRLCPECGSELIEKYGKYGKFIACSNFPKCKYSEDLSGNRVEKKMIGEKCPECNSELLIRKRKKDNKDFIACSNFPKCKYARNIEK